MLPRFIPIVSLISLSLASAAAQQLSRADQRTADAAMNSIRPDAIRAHMRFLSDSLLEGRGTGTRGHQIAAQYVATELEAIGVKPAGVNGTWFQSVPLRKITLATEQTSYEFVRDGKAQTLREGEEFATSGDAVYTDTNVDAAVVFVGFGVTAPDQHYDDYAGVDVHGKLVAILYGAPARFPSTERAYYSDGVVKSRNAVAHGAIGVLAMMTPEDQKRYAWKWIVPQIRQGDMRWLDVKGVPADSFPELHAGGLLSQSGTDMLFAGAPKTFAQACADANASKSHAFPLAVTAKIHTVSRHERITAPNVIGVLRGSDPKLRDQYVVYTAHTDHLGICDPVEGDNVCHGALDNASGTSVSSQRRRGAGRRALHSGWGRRGCRQANEPGNQSRPHAGRGLLYPQRPVFIRPPGCARGKHHRRSEGGRSQARRGRHHEKVEHDHLSHAQRQHGPATQLRFRRQVHAAEFSGWI